jgi:GDP-L-fucose synthase
MRKTSKIYVAGHNGLVGSAIVRKLKEEKHKNIITFDRKDLDLSKKDDVETMFRLYRPTYVFLAAAKVGGIHDNNTKSGQYFYENLQIQTNVMEAARKYGSRKLLFLGASSIYPRLSEQPIKEEYLLSSPLQPNNSGYSVAKIAGIEMCKSYRRQYGSNFISAIPCNLYGPKDNFNIPGAHVLPAFIRKFYEAAKEGIGTVELWGDGTPLREFLHSDDLAEALYLLMQEYDSPQPINIGAGYDISIEFLARMIADIIGYKGEITYNREYPNGTPKKLLDSTKITNLGWKPELSLEMGIKNTFKWFLENYDIIRK